MTTPEQPVHEAPTPPPPTERAEVLVDQLGQKLGQWSGTAGERLRRFWARAREEGEDMWAEAQDIRQHNAIGSGPAGSAAGATKSDTAAPTAEPKPQPRSRRPKKTAGSASS
ncbi:MAG TPA: hypothetical protein VE258_18260 [Ktedonobacterales bacterium]|nr:hypothetical protein [Ktedonobacterales bacterium]